MLVLLVGSGGRALGRRTVNRGDSGSIPPTAVLAISFTPHLHVSFGRDTKSRWSLLSGAYARGSKKSHTGWTCSGLTNSREKDNSCISSNLGCLEANHLRLVIVLYYTLSHLKLVVLKVTDDQSDDSMMSVCTSCMFMVMFSVVLET